MQSLSNIQLSVTDNQKQTIILEGGLRTYNAFHKKSEPGNPLVSIITVCLNSKKYLEQSIQSVINQTYDNIEYIIIDGGSKDGTLDIIRKYEDKIAYWVSENDDGIADAWNKGILASTGEIIGIINSDDWYELTSVDHAVSALTKNNNAGVVHGDRRQWNETGNKVKGVVIPSYKIDKLFLYTMPINHPTCFVRKKIYETYGLFKNIYKYSMDHEFFLRLWENNVKFIYLKRVLANMRSGGASYEHELQGLEESKEIALRHGAKRSYAYLYYYKKLLLNRCVLIADILKLKGFIGHYYRKINRRYNLT